MRRRLSSIALLLVTAVTASAQEQEVPPIETGLVERSGAALMLVDVKVTDEQGRPIRGLQAADFRIALNGRNWPVISADDLCPCDLDADLAALPAIDGADTAVPIPETPRATAPRARNRFVLYMDYSQFMQDGRVNATREARRWIVETMRPDDLVMIAAYAGDTGSKQLAGFTSDKQQLIAAVEEAYEEPSLQDEFGPSYVFRVNECDRCCRDRYCNCGACWQRQARTEWSHSRGSLEAFRDLLQRLQNVEGRKAVILFNQRGAMHPARYYAADEGRIGDHIGLVDEIAADAMMARATIHTAFVGDDENELAATLGTNLAQLTGGSSSANVRELSELTASAGRDCECIYRLGLKPPPKSDNVYRVGVEVRGRKLPGTFRATYLSPAERWMRAALAVLADPDSAVDVPLAVAIVPVAGRKGGWDVKVQVALNPDYLLSIPAGQASNRNWEVGALLWEANGNRSREMLGVSEARADTDEIGGVAILHERTFTKIRPGQYQLSAFVRDRWANVYGGASAEIELPRAGRRGGLTPPLILRAGSSYLPAQLPLARRRAEAATRSEGLIRNGVLPLAQRPIQQGEPLEFANWVCPGKYKDSIYDIRRFVSREGTPLFRFEEPGIVRAGDCARFRDQLATGDLQPGRYTYHVRWNRGAELDTLTTQAEFEIRLALPREP